MFENYPTYAKQILAASKNMSSRQKMKIGKMSIGCLSAAILSGMLLNAGGNAVDAVQIDAALDTLKSGFQTNSVVMEVSVEETGNESLFTEDVNPLSVSEEETLVQQVKDAVSSDKIASSEVNVIDDHTVEVTVTTVENIPVKITMKTDEAGNYVIESAKAILTEAVLQDKKTAAENPNSTEEQKLSYTAPLNAFEAELFASIVGIGEDSDVSNSYSEHMSVLAPEVVLTVPNTFEWKEVEQPTDEGEAEDNAENAENEANSENTLAGAASNSNTEAEEESNVNHIKQYARCWKDGAGSTVSVRTERLGTAFSNMNGLDAITKMKGYWEETSASVATGAGQELKNQEEGYYTEIFYDTKSQCWGYWGHVEYTDGSRNITYNRIALIDEIADQMYTVSYRNDCEVDGESHAYTLDDFKKIISNAPQEAGENAGDDVAMTTYQSGLEQVVVLPGHTKTIAEEKADAEAAAAAAESEQGADAGGEAGENGEGESETE